MPKAEKPCFAARLNYLTGRVRSLGAWAGLTVGPRRHIEPFLEHTAEMGDDLEAACKRDFCDVHLRGAK